MQLDIDLEALKEYLFSYLEDLKDFDFSFLNPLFWAAIFVIFLVLSRFWGEARKAFSFCLVLAIILLATSKLEAYAFAIFIEPFVSFLIRIVSLFIISVIFLYYAAIK